MVTPLVFPHQVTIFRTVVRLTGPLTSAAYGPAGDGGGGGVKVSHNIAPGPTADAAKRCLSPSNPQQLLKASRHNFHLV